MAKAMPTGSTCNSFFVQAVSRGFRSRRKAEKEEDSHGGESSDRKINVKAPSPRDTVAECASNDWSKNGSSGISHPNHAQHHRPLCRRDSEGDNTGATY